MCLCTTGASKQPTQATLGGVTASAEEQSCAQSKAAREGGNIARRSQAPHKQGEAVCTSEPHLCTSAIPLVHAPLHQHRAQTNREARLCLSRHLLLPRAISPAQATSMASALAACLLQLRGGRRSSRPWVFVSNVTHGSSLPTILVFSSWPRKELSK